MLKKLLLTLQILKIAVTGEQHFVENNQGLEGRLGLGKGTFSLSSLMYQFSSVVPTSGGDDTSSSREIETNGIEEEESLPSRLTDTSPSIRFRSVSECGKGTFFLSYFLQRLLAVHDSKEDDKEKESRRL